MIGNNEFLVGGGGGATRAGVKNSVILFEITRDSSLKLKSEFVFGANDDACMNLAAHPVDKVFIAGVNSSEQVIRVDLNIMIGWKQCQWKMYLYSTKDNEE